MLFFMFYCYTFEFFVIFATFLDSQKLKQENNY